MSAAAARVFISCGQAKDTDEVQIARAVAGRLRELGFDPYVAVEEQTLKGLKENLFRQIENSEYFVFVDFRREPVVQLPRRYSSALFRWLGAGASRGDVFRGSLFSHQELAIAAKCDLDVIVFRERGVELNGISRFIQANASEFSDREHLPALIGEAVRRRNWNPLWRNELSMVDDDPTTSMAQRVQRDLFNNVQQFPARFHHITVTNRHQSKPAMNCYVYLERVQRVGGEGQLPVPTIEHKWSGYNFPNAVIAPRSLRRFDAFWYPLKDAIVTPGSHRFSVEFNVFADSSAYIPVIREPGQYTLMYRVISENFAPAIATFRLTLPSSGEEPTLQRAEAQGPLDGQTQA